MKPSHQELTIAQQQDLPQLADGHILGLAKKVGNKKDEPSLTYQLTNKPNQSQIDKAFDILFEETLRQIGNLTSYDN